MDKMKVIFVTSNYKQNILKEAKSLSKIYEVEVLMWDRYHVLDEIREPSEFKLRSFRLKSPKMTFVLPFLYPFWWFYCILFLLTKNSEVIHAVDLDSLFPVFILKKFKKFKLYYTIDDFYADTIPLIYPEILRDFLRFLERYMLQCADHVFLVDENRFENIRRCEIKGLTYIYNTPVDKKNELKSFERPLKKHLQLFYAGLLDDQRGIRFLTEAVIKTSGVSLLIAGVGPLENYIKFKASKFPEKIRYLGFIHHDEVLRISACSDVIVALYDPEIPINRVASPNKLFESMMLAKPIIVNRNISVDKIVTDENCGVLVDYGDSNQLKRCLETLRDDIQLREKLGNNGRKAYDSKYSWSLMEKRLFKAYKFKGE